MSSVWWVLGAVAFYTSIPTTLGRKSYEYYCTGKCEVDALATSSPGVVMMGGGTDVDQAFVWQIGKAGGGDFLVLRASGDDSYNPYVYGLSLVGDVTPLNSVTTIVFNTIDASEDEFVLGKIASAEAIFFAGGDQSDYIKLWMGTSVQSLVQEKSANITIGGTSAGCAILGNDIYTGEKGSVTSDTALANPYNREMTFSSYFLELPFLGKVITDTHFVTRDRMGRMLAFMARELLDEQLDVIHGVGVNEQTALLLETSTGVATTVGKGSAYVCTNTQNPTVCTAGTPLTFLNVACSRLVAVSGTQYNFKSFNGGEDYDLNVVDGKIIGLPYGPV